MNHGGAEERRTTEARRTQDHGGAEDKDHACAEKGRRTPEARRRQNESTGPSGAKRPIKASGDLNADKIFPASREDPCALPSVGSFWL